MANLTIDATTVHLVRGGGEVLLTAPMAEAGTGGQYFRLNTTSGKLEKGNGLSTTELGTVAGVLLDSVPTVGLTGTIVLLKSNAIIDLGNALDGLAFDAPIYIGDTDATLSDTAGTSSRVVARVVPGFNTSATTPDKLAMLVP